jgi:CheY-like chemotaxis protein
LMDIQMPILDGFNATKQIRATGYTKPILALTAHASDEDLDRILEAGCNDRLVKPIDLDQLVSSILASTSLQRC